MSRFPVVRVPGVVKKFDQSANFQICDQGVEMLFSATFMDIPKIGNRGSNSHLAPNVFFGNEEKNIFFLNFQNKNLGILQICVKSESNLRFQLP